MRYCKNAISVKSKRPVLYFQVVKKHDFSGGERMDVDVLVRPLVSEAKSHIVKRGWVNFDP